MDPAANAVMAADIPIATQQSQEITLNRDGEGEPGVVPNMQITNEEVDCLNLTTGRDNKCWDELQLTTWVHNWIEGHTCYESEGFSSCFLRQVGWPELDCTGIKIPSCTPPPVKPNQDAHVWYVAYNIYGMSPISSITSKNPLLINLRFISIAINQYFGSWYLAVGGALSLASLNVEEIVQLLNPPDNTNLIVSDILIALTGIFSVAPGLGLNIGNLLDKAVTKATETQKSLRTGLQFVEDAIVGFPTIGRYLFPIDTPASSIIQIASLKTQLGDLIGEVQSNLNQTLVSIMANPAEFLAFASQGNFTAACPSLPDQQHYLLYAFNTYLVSACLRGNNIHGTIAKDTNVQHLATNGSQHALNPAFADLAESCEGYSAQNVCDEWWFSGAYGATFGLDHFSHLDRSFHDVLETLFTRYTTGQLLFDNAYACGLNGGGHQEEGGSSKVAVTVNPAGVNTQCLSQLRIVTWDMSCTGVRDKNCEFEEVQPQGMFLNGCGSGSFFSVMDEPVWCVPRGYLGPLVLQRGDRLVRDGGG
ncbi:MAG: hypothetical protein LQ339_002942 [Xanthoria mediterranea]|nr:MAG: hypothetical protein LQ339_002942 [Xanthoria mediterranea]